MGGIDLTKFLEECLSFWHFLDETQKKNILTNVITKNYEKNTALYCGGSECAGLVIVKSGQLRAFITSEDGKEISLYRLLPHDICIMSVSCMLKDINFHISLEMEKDCELIIIPANIYQKINEENGVVKSLTLNLLSSRFSDVMWVLEQLVFSNMGKRLAAVLIEQSILADSLVLEITHDDIAKDLGSAREVVSRLLKQFQFDKLVVLSRSKIEIVDLIRLKKFAT